MTAVSLISTLLYSDRVGSPGTTIFIHTQLPCMADRPDDNPSAAEIARWMEEDFWESVTEGIEQADNDVSTEE